MQTRTILVVALMTGVLTRPCALAGQAQAGVEAPWLGTWKLNLAKSAFTPGPPPFRRGTCKIEPWEDGVKVTYDLVRTRGGITHLEWSGKFDGRDYPIQGIDDYVVTNAYSRIDDRTYEVVQKVDGERASTARMAISPDGTTITTVTPTTTTVYDRQ